MEKKIPSYSLFSTHEGCFEDNVSVFHPLIIYQEEEINIEISGVFDSTKV